MPPNNLCIVIPVFNEQETICKQIDPLLRLNTLAPIIFVDGNSSDQTVELLKQHELQVITSPQLGRGAQISFGAINAPNDCKYILFLHIDTQLPTEFERLINEVLNESVWGHFCVQLNSDKPMLRIIQFMMNLRSKMTSIATGDQAMFVRKDEFLTYSAEVTDHPLMEDIFLSATLKKHHGRAKVIKKPVITSARYWSNHGVIKTIIKMWSFRLMYFLGVSPKKLYQLYYR